MRSLAVARHRPWGRCAHTNSTAAAVAAEIVALLDFCGMTRSDEDHVVQHDDRSMSVNR